MSKGAFFTFPLCLLAAQSPAGDILQTIVAHSSRRAGESSLQQGKVDYKGIRAYLAEHPDISFDNSRLHKEIVAGAVVCNVKLYNLKSTALRCEYADELVRDHEHKFGRDALVFIAADLLWMSINGELPFRQFSLLCAVNSVCGFKEYPVLIRRTLLIARQLGYKTPAAQSAMRPDQRPLTVQQLRDALDDLEQRDLIRRCQGSRTRVYFSTSLEREALRAAVKKQMAKTAEIRSRREADRLALGTNPEPNGNHYKTKQPEEPKKEPLKHTEPFWNQLRTKGGTTDGTT